MKPPEKPLTPEELADMRRAMKYFASRGGKARARNMTQAERSAAAKHAAEARWGKQRGKKP